MRVQVSLSAPLSKFFKFLFRIKRASKILFMKKNIHPETNAVKVLCTCWASFDIVTTIKSSEIRVEVCSKCHPHYTWEQKVVKTGAVDKFYERMKKSKAMQWK